jgi:asparagine synthase (glutamine-hydrolysing)
VHWHRLLARTVVQLVPDCIRRPAEHWMHPNRPEGALNTNWFEQHGVVTRNGNRTVHPDGLRSALIEAATTGILPRLLRHEDRNSMAFSIESRVPFLTPAMAQFTLSLPPDYLLGADGTSKRVFREAMRGIVPEPILARKEKLGFETPELAWLQALRPWVREVLSSDTARAVPVLRHEQVVTQAEEVLAGRQPFDWRVWRWINLVRWSELVGVEY